MRDCFLPPVPEIFASARLLDKAADALIAGDRSSAADLLHAANIPAIRGWTETLWGKRNPAIHIVVAVPNAPPYLSEKERPKPRMPTAATRRKVTLRDRRHCRFCGIPLIEAGVRRLFCDLLPEAIIWGRANSQQHAGLQCMWLQFDHVLPNSRGGSSGEENIVLTCAPCNFARMQNTLEENALSDPRTRPLEPTWDDYDCWDGLERLRGALIRPEA